MNREFPVDINTYRFALRTPIQLRFNDLDPYQHVNNASQQQLLDIGKEAYMHCIYKDKGLFFVNSITFILASYTVDFLSQITIDKQVEVHTSIYHVGNKSIRMIQKIVDTNTGEIFTVGNSVMACVDLSTRKPIPIPDEWRVRISTIEN